MMGRGSGDQASLFYEIARDLTRVGIGAALGSERAYAQGDLALGPTIGLDRQGQQARAVWLRAELSHRRQERRDRGCRGDAGSHLR